MTESTNPWTRAEFLAALRADGYKAIGQGCYRHKYTGKIIETLNYVDGRLSWQAWAEARQVPPPF